jgi:hypothetical protein
MALLSPYCAFDAKVFDGLLQSLFDGMYDAAWQEFWPRPAYVSFGQMMRRMLWNPHWNDNLFVVSCAERLVEDPTAHSRDEVYRRICDDLEARQVPAEGFRFRLVFVSRADDGRLQKEVLYVSDEDGGGML